MTLIVNSYGDNPQQPGVWAETFIPDQLIAGNLKLVTQPIRIPSGTYPRGTILGRATKYSVASAAGATNTGNGTIGSISEVNALLGTYTITAKTATTFSVTDPEGNALTDATAGTAYSDGGIAFTITAGGTAFVAGDTFTLTVVNSIGDFVLCVKTASDGSQNPVAVLADYADASSGAVTTGAYFMGEFNANAVSYDSSWTIEELTAAMPAGVFLKGAVIAADPGSTNPVTP